MDSHTTALGKWEQSERKESMRVWELKNQEGARQDISKQYTTLGPSQQLLNTSPMPLTRRSTTLPIPKRRSSAVTAAAAPRPPCLSRLLLPCCPPWRSPPSPPPATCRVTTPPSIPHHPTTPPAHPTPSYHAPRPSYHAPAQYADVSPHYNTQYAVKDDYSGNDFGAQEARDGYSTQGSYYVLLPDGRLQRVTYHVDGDSGYVADVTYEGEAQYHPDLRPRSCSFLRPRPSSLLHPPGQLTARLKTPRQLLNPPQASFVPAAVELR
ncbi:uncharacterized protein LOC135113382 [Scylla paramamosain]|uniref:uncharacterized protein LOC135113382 n=1 Tax=Scylla paramamosain TaxID=85552 RepID=UPI003083DF37